MARRCRRCGAEFAVTAWDAAFYERIAPRVEGERIALPPPTLCPDCRRRRRLLFRNERQFYHHRSALSGKPIISVISPDKPFKVFEAEEWWSDEYDPLAFGREFDPSRPFFDQFQELLVSVPHMNLIGSENEEYAYCHLFANCRRCYLLVESSNNEDCFYGYWLQRCLGCVDTSFSHECQYSYEVDNCYNCYDLRWCRDCVDCSESAFLESCIGCRRCLACINLHQKEYHVLNRPVARGEYERLVSELRSESGVQRWRAECAEVFRREPRRYAHIVNAEECSGDYIQSCRNCHDCYHAHDAEECRYGEHVWRNSRWNMDVSTAGREAELIYESINVGISSYNVHFSVQAWSCSDAEYCYGCFNSRDIFGCVGLKHGRYVILNREYDLREYEELRAKIIRHMVATGEYGEFFPERLTPFGYNESVSGEFWPLSRDEALARGLPWSDYESPVPTAGRALGSTDLPDRIDEVEEVVLDLPLRCEDTGRLFKIIAPELAWYRKHGVPLPRRHPQERHLARLRRRNPQHLWSRHCSQCGAAVQSTYAPERPEVIRCERCYGELLTGTAPGG